MLASRGGAVLTWHAHETIQENALSHRRPTVADLLARQDNGITLVRVAAAAVVVLSHAVVLHGGPATMDWAEARTPLSFAGHAVNVFFVLSGVLVAASLDRSSTAIDYLRKRVARIVPGLVVASLFVAFVIGPVTTTLPLDGYLASWRTWLYPVLAGVFLRAPATLPGVFEALPAAGMVNEPIWTLKYEVICYFLLPALVAAGGFRSKSVMGAALALALVLYLLTTARIDPHGSWTLREHLGRFVPTFLAGVAAYAWRDRVALTGIGALAGLIIAVALNGTPMSVLAWSLAAGYAALVASEALSRGRGAVLCAWFRRNDWSYGTYIYGWPVGQWLVFALPGLGVAALGALSLGMALALGALSWRWVEAPIMRLAAGPPGRSGVVTA
jgi:peptidoglycan/LPS O-acetylase OafA/YrhL